MQPHKGVLTGGILVTVVSAPPGQAIAQLLSVIPLYALLGNTWLVVGGLHEVTVIQGVMQFPVTQCIAAMVDSARVAASGCVMSTTSSIQLGQVAF